MTLKRGVWVTAGGSAVIGCVKRRARDGSWCDVDWHSHTKRMQSAHLTIQHTIPFRPLGPGWTVTDETRRAELEREVPV
jgi:hypothetical protein